VTGDRRAQLLLLPKPPSWSYRTGLMQGTGEGLYLPEDSMRLHIMLPCGCKAGDAPLFRMKNIFSPLYVHRDAHTQTWECGETTSIRTVHQSSLEWGGSLVSRRKLWSLASSRSVFTCSSVFYTAYGSSVWRTIEIAFFLPHVPVFLRHLQTK